MQGLLLSIDRFSTLIGKIFAWCIVLLTLQVTYEVTARYAFARPTSWGYDASYFLYGTLFMMAGAYTLARNGHVRGDFLYRQWPVRRQAAFDLVLYFVYVRDVPIEFGDVAVHRHVEIHRPVGRQAGDAHRWREIQRKAGGSTGLKRMALRRKRRAHLVRIGGVVDIESRLDR
jgi:hypothetical protein